jgi:hypothetical protein
MSAGQGRGGSRGRVLAACAAGVLAAGVAAACGGSNSTLPDVPDGGGGASSSGGAVDAGSCVAIPASDLPQASSPASGTVSGAGLDATLCPGGASARVEPAGASIDTAPYLFYLTYTVGSSSSAGDFLFASPAGATDGELNFMVGLSSPAPGQYTPGTSGTCGGGAFTYYLPIPEGLSCDAGTAPNCPKGCASECSGFGCDPCTPQAPSVSFTANAAGDCLGDTQPAVGTWSLSLTSVTAASPGNGGKYYTPHGSLTATMAGASGAAGTATLSITF